MNKQKREIIKFVSNTPVEVILDTEPTEAKSQTRESQWGTKTSYTYFVKDGRIMFPSEALHNKLKQYSKGDTVTINLVDGKTWSVSSDGAGTKKNSELQKDLDRTETTILLRKIALDIDLIKSKLFDSNTDKSTDKLSSDGEEDSLDF